MKWSNLFCFSRFSQPVHFYRFKPDNLLLSAARFSDYNLEKCTGWLNLEKRLDYFTGTYRYIPQLIKSHPKDKVIFKWAKSFPRKSLRNETISLWYYSLSSFQEGDTKFERFLPKNQHTQRKLLNFKICTLFWICMAIWPGVPFDAFQIC